MTMNPARPVRSPASGAARTAAVGAVLQLALAWALSRAVRRAEDGER